MCPPPPSLQAAAVAEGEQRQQVAVAAQAEAEGLRRELGALVEQLNSMRDLAAELEGLLERTEHMRGRVSGWLSQGVMHQRLIPS